MVFLAMVSVVMSEFMLDREIDIMSKSISLIMVSMSETMMSIAEVLIMTIVWKLAMVSLRRMWESVSLLKHCAIIWTVIVMVLVMVLIPVNLWVFVPSEIVLWVMI